MDLQVVSNYSYDITLEYGDVTVSSWRDRAYGSIHDDILILDLDFSNYKGGSRTYDGIYSVYDKIQSFLKADGTVILFMDEYKKLETQTDGKTYRMGSTSIFSKLGISHEWGVQSYQCVPKVDSEYILDFIGLVGESEYYVEYENCKFDETEVLMTRGEQGKPCGVAFTSFEGSGNGSLICLPRPGDITIRPEKWFKSTMHACYPYVPDHIKEEVKEKNEEKSKSSSENSPESSTSPEAKVIQICERFHRSASKLEDRYDNRPTIEVGDEYDVQDLLHALLVTEFVDVRSEEYSPSHAGSAPRIDFLLKDEEIGIEVKHAGIRL